MSEHARGYGTVVTSQANFLRVVVTRESMTQAHLDERALQLTNAMDRASQAGKTAAVAKLQEVLADEGPYELLCVVRALLKKIKQRVLVGDAVDVLGIDWVDRRAMVETVHTRRSSLVDPPVAVPSQVHPGSPGAWEYLVGLPAFPGAIAPGPRTYPI